MPEGQDWVSHGSYNANPKLSQKVRMQAFNMMRFRQFATIKEAFGKGNGESVDFTKYSTASGTGGTLVETETMPRGKITPTDGTLTVNEYGLAIPFTGKNVALSSINIKSQVTKALRNDQKAVLDAAVEGQMDACKIRAVSTASDAVVFTSNGTATSTATANMTKKSWRACVNKLISLNCPEDPEAGSYLAILSLTPYDGMYESLEDVWKYTKYPTNGEVGMYYNCRAHLETNALDGTIGASAVTGEGYFFGEDAVMEAISVPEEMRSENGDYGRSLGLAWYAILGFKIVWISDPDNRIVKWDSA